jgi:hypothetical protein
VALIRSRFAEAPYRCPFCAHWVHPGSVIVAVFSGSTVASGCLDCAWAAINDDLPSRREAA